MQIMRTHKAFLKHLGKDHDLCVQSDTLLLVGVFENFQNMCLEIYELDSAKKNFSAWISIASTFKNTKVKLDLLTYIDIFKWWRKE